LIFVDTARKRIKTINDTLIGNRQWMGAPFDLEWHEFLDRIPIIRSAYLAASSMTRLRFPKIRRIR